MTNDELIKIVQFENESANTYKLSLLTFKNSNKTLQVTLYYHVV